MVIDNKVAIIRIIQGKLKQGISWGGNVLQYKWLFFSKFFNYSFCFGSTHGDFTSNFQLKNKNLMIYFFLRSTNGKKFWVFGRQCVVVI